jgi:superfamily I DNA/RNA helicase/mRNA-degrading endonuclease RelE of RelBE toxin-antitoxin system
MTEFRIADSFTASLARLAAPEQKAAKIAVFDLQAQPSGTGLSFHRLDRARDRNFWSVRASDDIRIIVHRTTMSLLLCYVGHHDEAYRWAERRKIERHPMTGAAQMVEIRERVEEIVHRAPALAPPLFATVAEDRLLALGVPPEWVAEVKQATEDTLLEIAPHLPAEAAEALLELATGGRTPRPIRQEQAPMVAYCLSEPEITAAREDRTPYGRSAGSPPDGFDHPDAQRRFRLIADSAELARALEFPWETWTVFLHPAQRTLVERHYSGPARVAGSAGTGKTVVALHRAVHLARGDHEARVLLTTVSQTLAESLAIKLGRLAGNEPDVMARIAVRSIETVGLDLYARRFGAPKLAAPGQVAEWLHDASAEMGQRFARRFLVGEWTEVIDAWQIKDWASYRDFARLGRKTRLGAAQREALWRLFARVRERLDDAGVMTLADVFGAVTAMVSSGTTSPPFDYAVIDEAQDMGVAELRLLAAFAEGRPDGLFFAGDLGQRIFQPPFSWKSLGIDIRGRSHTLRVNYRTSQQIRAEADRLLPGEMRDMDGNVESRRNTVSVFSGAAPDIKVFDAMEDESLFVGSWIAARIAEGIQPDEIAVFVRSAGQLARAESALSSTGLPPVILDHDGEALAGHIRLGTMHRAKGLEFRAVAVMACDDEVLPLQERIESLADDAELEEMLNSERHLLYVACTRAREWLLVSGAKPESEFLQDLLIKSDPRPPMAVAAP